MDKQLLSLLMGLTLAAASNAANPAYQSLTADVAYDVASPSDTVTPTNFAPPMAPPATGLVEVAPGSLGPQMSLQPASYNPTNEYGLDCCPATCTTGYWDDHWYAGCDVGITSISYASNNFALNNDRSSLSLRPYLGWESRTGTGFRVQAWMTGMEGEAIRAGTGTPFDVDSGSAILDFDMYRRLQFDTTELTLGVGARSAGFGFGYADDTEDTIAGGGLSAFAEGYYRLRSTECSEWGMFGSGRISMLAGTFELDNSSSFSEADGTFSINEANMGVRYRRHLQRSDFLFQFQVEQQMWNTNTFGNIGYTTTGCRFGWEW